MKAPILHTARLVLSASILASAACSDVTGTRPSGTLSSALTPAFSTLPIGYGELSSSFLGASAANASTGTMWLGGGREARFGDESLMGGGLQGAFLGAVAFSGVHRGDDGPFGWRYWCNGTYNAATGRTVCATITGHGFTIDRSFRFSDASGAVQQLFDPATTDTVNVMTAMTGTLTFSDDDDGDEDHEHHDGWGARRGAAGRLLGDTTTILSATTTVNGKSDQTVGGLADGSTKRGVNGTSEATETTTGKSSRGDFTATRTVGDTTSGLVIPIPASYDVRPIPTAGTVTRSMKVTLTLAGQAPMEATRREVITFDGSNTVKITITTNDKTKNCTRALPFGHLMCQ